jgi:Holliday junction DNA helicase RuvA
MIARLRGSLTEKEPHRVVIDVGGTGYRAFIPLSTYYALPEVGSEAALRIHTHVREDALSLFGFASREELDLFEKLIEISGVGPRLALAILSGMPVADLVTAISDGDSGRLRGIPGIGPKTADRVILEMRDRIRMMPRGSEAAAGAGPDGSIRRDVVSALVNLGYREVIARDAVDKAIEADVREKGSRTVQTVLKRSLRYLTT